MRADAAQVFAALGDGVRLSLVTRLSAGGPASIVRLTEGAGMTRQAVTKHLAVLERAGLARRTRLGRESLWEVDREGLTTVEAWLDLMSRQWDDRLDALRSLVEG